MMKKQTVLGILACCSVLIGIAYLPSSRSGLSAEPSGWVDIMPKPGFKEWTRVAIPPDQALEEASQWTVEKSSGRLLCSGNGGVEWLRYNHELGDFIFHVEWRLTKVPGAKDYNGGIFVRNDTNGRIWYQAQVGNAMGGYFFGMNKENGSPKQFNLHTELADHAVKPAGEWNVYDIHCLGKKLVVHVNGVKTSEFDECNNLKGYLGVQAERSRIEFRHMRIKVLN
jgi:3-keto-disaccharide hydrolase